MTIGEENRWRSQRMIGGEELDVRRLVKQKSRGE